MFKSIGQAQRINGVSVFRKDHVLVDNSTFRALQIFSPRDHDANFKRGSQSSSREGLGIYKIFSANCKSKIGLATLRTILTNPIRNIDALNKRLDFINLVLHPANKEFVESLQDNMKHLSNDINKILARISYVSRANNRDWHTLYKTIYHTILINDLCGPYRERSTLLKELNDVVTSDLVALEQSIQNGLDFSSSQQNVRAIIRFGLDENLDAKKLRRQNIVKDVTAAARFAANNLPDFLDECAVVYLPEMGHLIAIKEWEEDCNPEQLQDLGFQFMFNLRRVIHYKDPLCVELDRRLGDISAGIIDHENRILRRLSGFVIKYNNDIREPLTIIGLMDCLISVAVASAQNMYVRPELNDINIIEIKDGRHPLIEQTYMHYQPNDFYSGGKYSKMKIITGPNGSGKSVYLRQVALIVFLAHVGFYVPANSANIGMLHVITSRIHATESASVRLSAFMIDVTQITHALQNVHPALLLIDEFGRGTSDEDGIILMVAALKKLLDCCTHVVVSTHFQQIVSFLPKSRMIEYQKMDHTMEDGVLYFLFKIIEGVSSSFAIEIAESVGLDADIIARAKELLHCLKNNLPFRPLEANMKRNLKDLDRLDIPEADEDP